MQLAGSQQQTGSAPRLPAPAGLWPGGQAAIQSASREVVLVPTQSPANLSRQGPPVLQRANTTTKSPAAAARSAPLPQRRGKRRQDPALLNQSASSEAGIGAGSGSSNASVGGSTSDNEQAPPSGATPSTSPPSRSSSRLGAGRPGSATPDEPAAGAAPGRPAAQSRPRSARVCLEDRVAKQMKHDAHSWTVQEVADYLELCGLGAYRRTIVHHAVNGSVFLHLRDQQVKEDLAIRNLGHREALLQAIAGLARLRTTASPGAESCGTTSEGPDLLDDAPSTSSSRPASPARLQDLNLDWSPLKVQEQRTKLLHNMEKAQAKEAHRRLIAEQAIKAADAASDEVQRLHARVSDLEPDRAGTTTTFDHKGRVAWLPVGTSKRPTSAGRPLSSGQPGSPISALSREIMSAQKASFLERLDADLARRQHKIQAVHSLSSTLSAQERQRRDLDFLQGLVGDRSSKLHDMLASDDTAAVDEALADIADMYHTELGLTDEQVASIKAETPAKKAAKLAGYVRTQAFMGRLQNDLGTRESRRRELRQRLARTETAGVAGLGHDLQQACQHFSLLGWSEEDLRAASTAASGSAGIDVELDALVKRAQAMQLARQSGSEPEFTQHQFKNDGLEGLQENRRAALQKAAEGQAADSPAKPGSRPSSAAPKPASAPPGLADAGPPDHLLDTVVSLSHCHPSGLSALHAASGQRKLLLVWRAVRSQEFVLSMARKEEERRQRQEQLERELYPYKTKKLPKDAIDCFFERLMADAAQRRSNRDALAEKAKAAELAKLLGKSAGSGKPRR